MRLDSTMGSIWPLRGTFEHLDHKNSSRFSAIPICALYQALWSAPSFAETEFANPSSTDWAILDSVPKRPPSEKSPAAELTGPVGAALAGNTTAPRVTYVGPYIAGTRYSLNDVVTESGTSYIATTNGAREDPANDVRFSVGNWAVFSAENPRWSISATGTAATPQPNGPKNFSTSKGFQRPVELTAVEPPHKQSRDAFPGCNNAAQPLDPFYQSRYLGADCGTVRTRTDYGVVGSMLILSLFQ